MFAPGNTYAVPSLRSQYYTLSTTSEVSAPLMDPANISVGTVTSNQAPMSNLDHAAVPSKQGVSTTNRTSQSGNGINQLISNYKKCLEDDPQKSVAIATLKTLIEVLENDNSITVVQLRETIRAAIDLLKQIESSIQVESVAEIFLRFITLDVSRFDSFTELKRALLPRSKEFLQNRVIKAKARVAKQAEKFIANNTRILIHARSFTVLLCLVHAKECNKKFYVYVTESRPDQSGLEMSAMLKKENIEHEIIMDSSIGNYLEKVDMVMVGADGVCESGGIINKVGTFPLAICATALNKPFYVVAESYKFIRMFPLNQSSIYATRSHDDQTNTKPQLDIDYTPPSYITLMLTDLGPLTTAAISDELMKLYL